MVSSVAMIAILLLGAAALAPSLLLVAYFHQRDAYPEPAGVLWRTFGLGILIIAPVCLVAWPLDSLASQLGNPLAYGFASAFLGAAIPEEIFKFLVLYFYAARHMHFDEPMDGIVYGATASLGFATLENVLYVSNGGMSVAIMRALLAVPGHAFLGVIMGYYVGQAKFTDGDRKPLLLRAIGIPIVLHGLYDAPLLATERLDDPTASATGCIVLLLLPMVVAIVIGEAVWAIRLVRRLRAEQLAGAQPAALATAAAAAAPPAPPPLPAPFTAPVPAPAPVPARVSTPSPPGRVAGWLATLGGGLLTCAGSLFTLGIAAAFAFGEVGYDERLAIAVGGVILGPVPLAVGILLFVWGVRRLNRAASATPPAL